MYAYAVDGLDFEQRQAFDRRLNAAAPTGADTPAKVRQQREAQAALMAAMSKAGASG